MLIPETEIVLTKEGVELARTVVRPGDYVIGSDEAADIVIEDDFIAPRHAQLTVNYHELFIEDLGSMSGTFVAGKQVTRCTRLWPSQRVQLGSVVLETRRIKDPTDPSQSLAPETAMLQRVLPEEFRRERKYEIGGLVAQGGMGAILDARQAAIERSVAMKVMLSSGSERDMLRFVTEAKITGQLEHPNIVPVHELGIDEYDQVFYTMKFVRGITLKKVFAEIRGAFPPIVEKYPLPALLTVFQKVCDALAFAHSKGVLHRDLKPENIMLGDYGEVLVMDWGLAKFVPLGAGKDAISGDASGERRAAVDDLADDFSRDARYVNLSASLSDEPGSVTMAGTVLGTPNYMSPEQARGEVDSLDERTDVYALGAILYELLALRPPINGETKQEVIEKVRLGQIDALAPASRRRTMAALVKSFAVHPSLPHLPGGRIPDSLAAVAMKALSFDPADRYASVPELQGEIMRYQSGFATTAEGASLPKQLLLLVGRHQRDALILAGSVVALLAIGLAAFAHISHERDVARHERERAEEQRTVAEMERQRAERESERAQKALVDLRRSAPAYHGQARALIDEQRFDEALEKIAVAIALAPENADYHLFRAHTLQAMQRLPEAIDAYRKVLALRDDNAGARTNLDLSERLLRENGGQLPLTSERQTQLLDAIIAQKRAGDSILLARALGREADVATALIRARLKSVMMQEKWKETGLQRLPDGTFSLDVSGLSVPELSILQDLPISALQIADCGATDLAPLARLPLRDLNIRGLKVTDLSPLKALRLEKLNVRNTSVASLQALAGMPLRDLAISETAVTDLSPLRGMALRSFAANAVRVRDLSPLQGMPLEHLSIRSAGLEEIGALAGMPLRSAQLGHNPLRDISPLRKAPLTELDLAGCDELRDVSPLAECKHLRTLLIPAHIAEINFIRALPNLQRLSSAGFEDFDYQWVNVTPAAEFLARQGDRLARLSMVKPRLDAVRAELRKLALEDAEIEKRVKLDHATAAVDIDFSKLRVTDLSLLKGLPVRSLDVSSTKVADLSPLRGMPLVRFSATAAAGISDLSTFAGCATLQHLGLTGTSVRDLRPLAGLKLALLHLEGTKVTDLSPLRGMPLRHLSINRSPVTDVSPLLACPLLEDLTLTVSRTLPSLSALRRLPNLAYISEVWSRENGRASQTAAQFWAQFDAAAPERENDARVNAVLARIRLFSEWRENRVEKKTDGTYRLDLGKLPITDLAALRDLPLSNLNISNTVVSDLTPLTKCPLRILNCYRTPVRDLTPLRDVPIDKLELSFTKVVDLRPLKGMQLRWLSCHATEVSDLGPLKGMPLEFLKIGYSRVTDLNPLEGAPLNELDLENTAIKDISALRDRPLRRLILAGTGVTDLRALTSPDLAYLRLSHTRVRDIAPLRGLPLQTLLLDDTEVTDLTPLLECTTLRALVLPPRAQNVAALRKLPALQHISFQTDGGHTAPAQTAEDFWAAFDPQPKK